MPTSYSVLLLDGQQICLVENGHFKSRLFLFFVVLPGFFSGISSTDSPLTKIKPFYLGCSAWWRPEVHYSAPNAVAFHSRILRKSGLSCKKM